MTRSLDDARLLLCFTPSLCPTPGEALEVLGALLPELDLIQVRIKARGDERSSAREHFDWTSRVLDLVAARGADVPVTVNDRVDVARALASRGCAGVHLGQDDCPPALARELLGPHALVGLSTHDAAQVARAEDEPVNYLGFGPVFPTRTKGYERGLGPERAWVASSASSRPVFAIGGIDALNAAELANVGRVAVSSALLAAPDPARAAARLRAALEA